VADILTVVSIYSGHSIAALTGPERPAALALTRQCAMLLTRQLTSLSLAEIGAQFGDRNHGTVIHACRVVATKRRTDKAVASLLETCAARIRRLMIQLSDLPPMPVSKP
jgi:chromosomal replication initiator protein